MVVGLRLDNRDTPNHGHSQSGVVWGRFRSLNPSAKGGRCDEERPLQPLNRHPICPFLTELLGSPPVRLPSLDTSR